jgi:hypothetical protein
MSREAGWPASPAPDLALVRGFGGDLDPVADLRGLLARDVAFALGFALLSGIVYPPLLNASRVYLGVPPKTAHHTRSRRWIVTVHRQTPEGISSIRVLSR